MLNAGVLTFRGFAMQKTLPIAAIQDGEVEILRGRKDVGVFGAQAVHAYVNEPRMIPDIELLSVSTFAFAS